MEKRASSDCYRPTPPLLIRRLWGNLPAHSDPANNSDARLPLELIHNGGRMNLTNVDQIVNAVLYQDHILYPYRSSARKGRRQPFTPGRLYPDYYCVAQNGPELCMMQTECLL